MNGYSLVRALKKYTQGWVSISSDYKKVIASGNTLPVLLEKLKKMGNPKGYLMKAAKDYSRYIGQDSIFQVAGVDFRKFKGYVELRFRKDLN